MAVLLVMKLVAAILSFGVVALVGLIGLESKGCSHEPHPVVGRTVLPSCRAVFGRWDTIPVVTAWRCYHVCAA